MDFVSHSGCFDWYKKLEGEDLILSFKGDFNHDLVKSILFLTEEERRNSAPSKKSATRVFGVLVECLQNICKHGESFTGSSELKPGIALIGRNGDAYRIGVGNIIKQENMLSLITKIEELNGMTAEELRNRQMETLKNSTLSEEGNAGIGLIQIARKTARPIRYFFKQLADGKAFYSLELIVKI